MPEAWLLKLRTLLVLDGANEASTRVELRARGSHTGTVVAPDGAAIIDLSESKAETFAGMAEVDNRLSMDPFEVLRYGLVMGMADLAEALDEGLEDADEDEAAIEALGTAFEAYVRSYNDGFEGVTRYDSVSPAADAAHIERLGNALVASLKTLEDAIEVAQAALFDLRAYEDLVEGLSRLKEQTKLLQQSYGPLIAYLAEVVRTEAEEDDLEARAAAFFAKYSGGALDKAIQGLQGRAYAGMMEASAKGKTDAESNTMVLGRLKDTAPLREELEASGLQDKVLALETGWSLAANDAFMKSGLDTKGRFLIATKLATPTLLMLKTQPTSAELLAFFKAQEPDDGSYRKLTAKQQQIWDTHKEEDEPIDRSMWNEKRGPAVSIREIGLLLDDGYQYLENPTEGQMMVPTQTPDLLAEIRGDD